MPTVSLTLPVAGTTVTAGLHSANYSALQTLLNGGLDTSNWASGKIFAPSKLMQESAVDGDGLAYDNAAGIFKRTTDKTMRVGALTPGTNGQVITTSGGVAAWGAAGATVYARGTATVDVNTSVAETSLFTQSIAANDMGTNRALRLTAIGDYLHNNAAGDTIILRIKFGGVTLYQSNASSLGAATSANRKPWRFDIMLANLAATNSQMLQALFWANVPSVNVPTTGIGTLGVDNFASGNFGISTLGTVDTTAPQTLDVTVQWSASSANNSFRQRYGVLELV